ncbi:AAA family ATPase [Flagellimonas allohymeniacidonis]|uniref:ATPase n=1 Tax=Flagellimonas allohymeniacidonis TaxID=2517819 RepID=A0A4Q8QDW7_9FLAO|nr:ATP-binding protein [Allomuricauda hymeniacidonis]TAI48615.1 ATPase [Allomuricauda hymeniacidonis]
MGKKKVVVTGAPGTGKTSIINGLEEKGFHCFHEIIRDMTSKAKTEGKIDSFVSNPLVFVEDSLQFNKDLLSGRTQHYLHSLNLSHPVSFFDRGIPDVLAYMDFFDQDYDEEFVSACENYRYNTIFLLPPWEQIYVSDNERLETYAEAEQIHNALLHTYTTFGYEPLIVPKSPVEQRIDYILDNLNSQ